MTTVERVLEILRQDGYRELPKPLMIGAMPFDFAHTLVAEERALDLIVIVDLAQESDDRRLIQKIHALARALDVMGSKRPITTILASAQPDPTILEALGRVCRVLPVGAPSGPRAEETLRDWLAALLPLAEPEPVGALADWKTELRKHLLGSTPVAIVDHFLAASEGDKESVEQALAGLIREAVKETLEEGDGE